jgi:hypothetical protein
MSNDQNNKNDLNQPMSAYGSGGQRGNGGNGRQGLGNAFVMSLVRQIARSLGTLLVRIMTGGRR